MNKQELIQKITEKLGADERESKIAFEIFIDKVTNRINENLTIRIPDIGIFQLKKYLKKSPGKVEQSDKSLIQYYLLAVPFSFIDEASEIISFNVSGAREEKDLESSPFSFSIDKPIIPLKTINKKDLLVQSSYIQLQRKFENEVDKLLETTVYLNDFSIDFKPSELELLEIDVDTTDEKLFERNLAEGETGNIPWDFGNTSNDKISLEEFDLDLPKTTSDSNKDEILNQFNIRKQIEFVDRVSEEDEKINEIYDKTDSEKKVEVEEKESNAENDELKIEELYDKIDKPVALKKDEPEIIENDEDIKIENFSMNHFTKSTMPLEENVEAGYLPEEPVVYTKPAEPVVEMEKSNTFFWVLISTIILITVGVLFYYFFYIVDADNNSADDDMQQATQRYKPPAKVDTSFQVKDTLENTATVPAITNQPSVKNDSLVRFDNKLKHVGGNIYTNGLTYTYQVSSWKSKSIAEKDVMRLRSLGYDAYISVRNPQSPTPWYLVRVGDYQSVQEAKEETINIK